MNPSHPVSASNPATVHLELTPEAKERLTQLAERTGMTQTAILQRLLEWYVHQEHAVQADAMGHFHNMEKSAILEMILKRFANTLACLGLLLIDGGAFVGDIISSLAA